MHGVVNPLDGREERADTLFHLSDGSAGGSGGGGEAGGVNLFQKRAKELLDIGLNFQQDGDNEKAKQVRRRRGRGREGEGENEMWLLVSKWMDARDLPSSLPHSISPICHLSHVSPHVSSPPLPRLSHQVYRRLLMATMWDRRDRGEKKEHPASHPSHPALSTRALADTLHLLGIAHHSLGEHIPALRLVKYAYTLSPDATM
jgi:hypothetical protein